MMIAIPTKGRTTLAQQWTWRAITSSKRLQRDTYLVCPPEDQKGLRAAGIPASNIIIVKVSGIAAVRQAIIDMASMEAKPYVLMLDDDMLFYRRASIRKTTKLVGISENGAAMEQMVSTLERWLTKDKFVAVGLSARQGNNHVFEPYVDATRMMNAYAFNAKTLRDLGIKFSAMKLMEDFYVTLSLLTRGFPNRVSYEYCWNQRGSGTKGGCSTYRTPELQAEQAHRLHKFFPDFVKVVEKTSKSSWKGLQTRTDVTIQWRKAFQFSISEMEV